MAHTNHQILNRTCVTYLLEYGILRVPAAFVPEPAWTAHDTADRMLVLVVVVIVIVVNI